MGMKHALAQLVPMNLRKRYWAFEQQQRYEKDLRLKPEQYRQALIKWYRRRASKDLDLDNPRTFGEKIQYLKLYDSTPQKGQLADKYGVRSYVTDKLGQGHLVPLLHVWDHPEEIDFRSLPDKYVLKTTLGSGTNIFVTPNNPIDYVAARKKLASWLSTNYAFVNGFELQYDLTQNRIIAERYMDFGEQGPVDYRFFCSYGNIFAIMVDTGSTTHHYHRTVFDPSWNVLNVRATHPRHPIPPHKPSKADEMAQDAQILSKDFSFMRADFYEYQGHVLVGELTFTPESGLTAFDPESFGLKFGNHVVLPSHKQPYKGVIL